MIDYADRPPLTRQRIIGLFELYFQLNRTPPTIRDLCLHIGVQSSATIHSHLRQLTRQGVLTHVEGRSRSYELSLTQRRAVALSNFEAWWHSPACMSVRFKYHDVEGVLYETALQAWLQSRGLDETQV